MPAPIIVIDGAMPYGTAVITINAVTYIADDINVTRAVDEATDRKATGAPNRARSTAGFDTMSMTLQAPSGTSGYPVFGGTFTLTLDDNYGAELWRIDPINIQQSNDPTQIRKLPVTAKKVYNGSVTLIYA